MSDNGYQLPPPEIHDRGRGPEIKGTRITVYDVMDYHPLHPASWIATCSDCLCRTLSLPSGTSRSTARS